MSRVVLHSDSAAAGWLRSKFPNNLYSSGKHSGISSKQHIREKLLDTLARLNDEGIAGPRTHSYAVTSLLDMRCYEDALRVKGSLESSGRVLPMHGYVSLVDFHAEKGEVKGIYALWKEVTGRGLEWDTPHFFTAVLGAFLKAGFGDLARRVFQVSLLFTEPDKFLVAAYVGLQKTVESGVEVVQQYNKILAEPASREAMMTLCSRLKPPLSTVFHFFDPSSKNPVVWSHYLACHTEITEVHSIIEKMEQANIKLLPSCFTRGIAVATSPEDAVQLYQKAYKLGVANLGVTCFLLERLVNDFEKVEWGKILVARHPELGLAHRTKDMVKKLVA